MNNIALLQPFHDGWADQQGKLLDQLRPLTMEQMQLRPAPKEFAVWQLASNMNGGRLYWLCFILGEDDLGVGHEWAGWEDDESRPRSADEIEAAFLKTWAVVEATLNRWTEADITTPRTSRDFWGRPITITPGEVIWKLMTHEAHHGAEISAILRVNGLRTTLNW